MKLHRWLAITLLTCPASAAESVKSPAQEITMRSLGDVRTRLLFLLLGGHGEGSHRRAAISLNDVWCSGYLAQPRELVAWPDASDATVQKIENHAGNLRRLAIVYSSDIGRFYRSAELRQRVELGLSDLLEHYNPKTLLPWSWYRWQIAIPNHLGVIALLMGHDLSPDVFRRLREALAHQLRDMLLNGANAAWEARNQTYLALVENDPLRLERAAAHMFRDVSYGRESGVCEDYGYVFHGRVPYAGGYGAGFAQTVSQFMYLFAGTPWAASPSQRELIANFLLEHARWFMFGGRVDLLINGRSFTNGNNGWDRLAESILTMAHVESARREELISTAAVILAANGSAELSIAGFADAISSVEGALPTGYRYWPSCEIGAFNAKTFHVGFRQYSSRVQDYEYMTLSDPRGWNLAYGFTNILRADGSGSWFQNSSRGAGREPAAGVRTRPSSGGRLIREIDMEHLPGATTRVGGNPVNSPTLGPIGGTGFSLNFGTSHLSGGVGWQHGGVAGFVLVPPYGDFSAKKSLHFFPTGFWSLGSEITSTLAPDRRAGNEKPIHTTVLQWPSDAADPSIALADGRTVKLVEGEIRMPAVRWFWIERIAVVFAEPAEIFIRRRGQVVTVWLDHGTQPISARYAYATLPDVSVREAREFADRQAVHPVCYDERVHAVRDETRQNDGFVFFEAASCLGMQADRAAIVYRGSGPFGGVLTFQDPLHTTTTLTLHANISGEIALPDSEVTVSQASTGPTTIRVAATAGRTYRFGYGPTGKEARSIPREDLADLRAFRLEQESDATRTFLTIHLPARAVSEGFKLSLHGEHGHQLATLDDDNVIERISPTVVRYLWNRKSAKTPDTLPEGQTYGDFRLYLRTQMARAEEFFTVPKFDAKGDVDPAAQFFRDRNNPHRPRAIPSEYYDR